jgi:crotonobetainyl-CoA:carnitine CoA-transferase CaiB-like acyl-CoA transferase
VKARGSLVEVVHPRAGKVRVPGPAARLSDTPAAVRTASPLMGQHTEEVLGDMLGLNADEIADLRSAGAFGPA